MVLKDLPNHHAVLLVDENRDTYGTNLWNELKGLSPAHTFFNQTVLNIETAREIISWAESPYNDEKIALISFHTAGISAQNAMLKILEEPRVGVRFIILTSNRDNLLGTVTSRLLEVTSQRPTANSQQLNSHINATEFLKTSYTARMKLPFVVELLAREDEEGRKDRERVRKFILSLADTLSVEKVEPKYIIETMQVASYASDPSASGKALVEYLSLLLPQVK